MSLILYAVKNREGKWFRRKGYGGYGETWVENFELARIYNRIGPARAICSFFADKWPDYGIPDLVSLEINSIKVLSEKDRVVKSIKKKHVSAARQEALRKEWDLQHTLAEYHKVKARLKELESR